MERKSVLCALQRILWCSLRNATCDHATCFADVSNVPKLIGLLVVQWLRCCLSVYCGKRAQALKQEVPMHRFAVKICILLKFLTTWQWSWYPRIGEADCSVCALHRRDFCLCDAEEFVICCGMNTRACVRYKMKVLRIGTDRQWNLSVEWHWTETEPPRDLWLPVRWCCHVMRRYLQQSIRE